MSQDIGNPVVGSMLGHVESQAGHHRRHPRGPHPGRGRRHLRRLQGLGLQADRPLQRSRARPPSNRDPDDPRPHRAPWTRPVVELILTAPRHNWPRAGLDAGPETIAWHLEPPPRHRWSPGRPSAATSPAPAWSPPSRGSDRSPPTSGSRQPCRTRPGSPTSPTTASPPDGTRRRRRDHQLARRLHPLRPARHRPPPDHRAASCTATFRQSLAQHGIPASTLTDNGMVYTARFAGGRGGRNTFESELRRLHVVQKNSRPSPPHHLREGRDDSSRR